MGRRDSSEVREERREVNFRGREGDGIGVALGSGRGELAVEVADVDRLSGSEI